MLGKKMNSGYQNFSIKRLTQISKADNSPKSLVKERKKQNQKYER
jgi:hypothetical protein